MTNDEAIKEIKDASDSEVRYGDTEYHYDKVMKRVEAFDMAIKALETQTCEDCISREEAIRVAEQGQIQGYEWQFKKLCNLPSVTSQQTRWIPVSERLPKENVSVIGTTKFNDIYETELYDDCGEKKWYADGNYDVPIVAWLPLPEPYRESGDKE